MLNVYLMILYVLHHAIQIQVHLILEHKVYKLMVVLFHLYYLLVVGIMLEIVVVVDFDLVVHLLIHLLNCCLYLYEMMMIMFELIEVLLHYLQNIQREQIINIEMKVMNLYYF